MPAVPNPDLRTWPSLAARWQLTHTYTPHKRAQKKGDVSLTLSKMGRQMPSRPLVELVPSLEIWLVKLQNLEFRCNLRSPHRRAYAATAISHNRDVEARRKDDPLSEKFCSAFQSTHPTSKNDRAPAMQESQLRRFQSPAARRSAASTSFCSRRSRASGVW